MTKVFPDFLVDADKKHFVFVQKEKIISHNGTDQTDMFSTNF